MLTGFGEVFLHLASEKHKHGDHYRDDREDDQRQRYAHRTKNDERADDLYCGNKKFLGAVVSKLGYVKEVVRDSRHQRSDSCVVVVGERQLLKMLEKVVTHIGLDPCTHYVTDVGHIIVCDRVDYTQNEI